MNIYFRQFLFETQGRLVLWCPICFRLVFIYHHLGSVTEEGIHSIENAKYPEVILVNYMSCFLFVLDLIGPRVKEEGKI